MMKKIVSIFIVMILCLSMAACGSSRKRADEALTGKYVSVSGTALGMTLTGEDIVGFTIELKSKGNAVIELDGDSIKGSWTNDDSSVTLTVEGTDMVGELGDDTITFKEFLKEQVGMSIDITFGKDGTDAANPDNYLPEEEKALIGDWTGVSVVDALDQDASGEISPDALKATFNKDHTASINLNGDEIAAPTWSFGLDMVSFEGEVADGASLYSNYKDGVLTITYSNEDSYYTFTMEK